MGGLGVRKLQAQKGFILENGFMLEVFGKKYMKNKEGWYSVFQ